MVGAFTAGLGAPRRFRVDAVVEFKQTLLPSCAGLIPYMALVGGAAAVSGGTYAYQATSPADTRLTLSARHHQRPFALAASHHHVVVVSVGQEPRRCGAMESMPGRYGCSV
jgi:hypothetical protein